MLVRWRVSEPKNRLAIGTYMSHSIANAMIGTASSKKETGNATYAAGLMSLRFAVRRGGHLNELALRRTRGIVYAPTKDATAKTNERGPKVYASHAN